MTFRQYIETAGLRLDMTADCIRYGEDARAKGYGALAAASHLQACHNLEIARRAVQGAERKLHAGRPLPVRRVKKGGAS